MLGGSVKAASAGLPDLANLQPLSQPERTQVYDRDGHLIEVLHDEQDRIVVPLTSMPQVLRDAVLAAEDERFYQHHGIDDRGILRALLANLIQGQTVQGGSTITQQLVRNAYPDLRDRSLVRKVKEASLAAQLEERMTKDQILEAYLNRVYFGAGYYGVEAASRGYFGRHVADLSLAQAATLAGLIREPEGANPRNSPDRAVHRRAQAPAHGRPAPGRHRGGAPPQPLRGWPAHHHHPRHHRAAAGRAGGGHLAAGLGPGRRPGLARPAQRRRPRDGRRAQLQPPQVQPGDPGGAAGRLLVQALRPGRRHGRRHLPGLAVGVERFLQRRRLRGPLEGRELRGARLGQDPPPRGHLALGQRRLRPGDGAAVPFQGREHGQARRRGCPGGPVARPLDRARQRQRDADPDGQRVRDLRQPGRLPEADPVHPDQPARPDADRQPPAGRAAHLRRARLPGHRRAQGRRAQRHRHRGPDRPAGGRQV